MKFKETLDKVLLKLRLKKEDTFCPLLFQHLATNPNGWPSYCCFVEHSLPDSFSIDKDEKKQKTVKNYELGTDSIESIYNSDSFRQARLDFLRGRKPKSCDRCFNEEKKGIKSKRLQERERFVDFDRKKAKSITDKFGYIKKHNIQFEYIELRLGNICNVKCRTCSPWSSSKWIAENNNLQKQGLGIYFDSKEFNYNWSESEEFWDDLLDHCKNLKVILVNGGEPTLNKEHYKLLQRLIDTELNKSVFLKYHINMTNVPDKLLELWKWFPYLKVSCSIDDIGERNDYIRFPTKWEDVNKNLKRLLDNNINISITQTVGFMNYINIPEFHKHFTDLGIKDININLIHHPVFLGPSVLPDKIRDDAHHKFDEYFKGGNDQINVIINTFSQPQNKELWEKTKLFTKSLDKSRKQYIGDYLPEFKKYIRENKKILSDGKK